MMGGGVKGEEVKEVKWDEKMKCRRSEVVDILAHSPLHFFIHSLLNYKSAKNYTARHIPASERQNQLGILL
jgi:hypothetical protein